MADEKHMKIEMFGHKRIPSREGGVEIVVEELATRMIEKGNRVICYNRKGHHVSGAEFDGQTNRSYKGIKIVPVWTLDKKGLAAMTSSFFAALKVIRSNTDVVHIHAEGPAAMCGLIKILSRKNKEGKKKKVIVTIHGLDWQRAKWGGFATKYIRWGEKQAVKYADNIIVLSKGVQKYFKQTYNRDTEFIPNGVSKPEIRKADEIKRIWGLEKDSYVLFLGRIVPEKGLRYLIQAWKNISTDKKLIIAGGTSDTQDFVVELKKMSASDDRIVFVGFQQGRILEELYSNAYIYTLPSDLEGMPLSLLEAMSYGNCCVVSNIDECAEVVEDNAVVFEHSNVNELRRVLQELLNSPEKVQRYKNEASEFIIGKYNWDDVVDKTLELYR